MNKIKKLLVVAPLALASVVAFAGCEDPHEHNLEKTDAVVATCTTAGNTEYYTCEDCGKFYSDAEAKHEIDENSWILAATGHAWTDANDHNCNNGCGHVRETATYNEWDGTKATALPTAEQGVITITTAEELAKLADEVNAGEDFDDVTIKLGADINLKNIEWTPIGYGCMTSLNTLDPEYSESAIFRGTFDGNGHTISNLKITTFIGGAPVQSATGVGLFGAASGATIKNFKIDGAVVSGNHWVGAAVGFARGTLVDNVDVNNAVVSCTFFDGNESGDKAGAVIGLIGNSSVAEGIVRNCDVTNSSVNAARDAGQVIGCLSIDNVAGTGSASQTDNTATNVTVTDNNNIQNTDNNDNIKNDIVGRINNKKA